ncbi:hypothetical protein V6N13_130493 [Hibiscus sabdariffa]
MGSLDPPLKRKLPRRPKHKRKREEGEVRSGNKWTKGGVKMACGLCGLNGHNIRTCPNKKQDNLHTRAHRYASTSSQLTASSQQHTVVSELPTTFSQQHTTVSELHAARAPKLTIMRP